MRIILCRHGETDFNVQKRLQGILDTEINGRGRKQARLVAQRLKGKEIEYAFSSPLKRCRETAKEIMKFHKAKLVFRPDLREIDLGIYAGMDRDEIDHKYPEIWARRVDNKYSFHHEGGESYRDMDEKRVRPLLKEFSEKYSSRKILIVTHMGFGRLLIGNLLGLGPNEKMNVEFPNDCIYFINYLPHKTEVKYFLAESGKAGEGCLGK